jgi:phage N-6-adenine-methyltransferase
MSREILPPQDGDAIEIGDLYRKGKSSMVDSMRYLVEAGQRLIAKKDGLEHGLWLPWLEMNATALGFDSPRTAQLLMRGAEKAKSTSHLDEGAALQLNREIWGNRGGPRTLGTGETEWYTPRRYVELARRVLGTIDLDPASCDAAQKTVRATTYYTKAEDGLSREWRGRVWLNPPYAQPDIVHFIDKLITERSDGRVTAAIALVNNYTDTGWFHAAAEIAEATCLTRGRVKFVDVDGSECDAPAQGSVFFYFGDRVSDFAATFLEVGLINVPYPTLLERPDNDDGIPECLRRAPKATA